MSRLQQNQATVCHHLHFNPLDYLLPLFNLVKSLGARVRTSLSSGLPGNEFLFTIGANLDNSQITTYSGVFVWVE